MRSRLRADDLSPLPETGDVVVSNPSATVDYEVSIVPNRSRMSARHDVAVAKGQELAERLGVDLWLTQDHTHFLRLASYREEDDNASRS